MAHATPADLFARLEALGLKHRTVEHPPVFTVEEARETKNALPGAHTKNLFLKDRKDRLFLCVAEAERRADLKSLAQRLGAGRFSFGSAALLLEKLGVTPGSVTPFALMNDAAAEVTPIIDKALLEAEVVNAHPLINTATTAISPEGLLAFLASLGRTPLIFDFEA
ncbi:MAG: prolyl-tRNA synthetase associated domain-containing protein [Alphaproteobacteria bacterium]|nr:prolyl-tRNA synthetase associated domain-containing protein [Alphaproteobacteria bacterium]